MTLEKFKKILNNKGIKFTIEGETFIISKDNGYISLNDLTTIPRGTRFENKGGVRLNSLTTLPEEVVFKNNGIVFLNKTTTLPKIIRFNNNGHIELPLLTTLPKETIFDNNGKVFLNSKATKFNPIFRNKENIYLVSFHNKVNGQPTFQDQHGTKLIFEF